MEEGNKIKQNWINQYSEKIAITVSFFFKIAETIVIAIKCTINLLRDRTENDLQIVLNNIKSDDSLKKNTKF